MKRRIKGIAFVVLAGLASSPLLGDGPFQFYSVTPCRVVNTNGPDGATGGPVLAHATVRSFPIYGPDARDCGIPPGAKAAALNIAVIWPSSAGNLTLYPYNTSIPPVSAINFAGGEFALANGAIIPLADNSNLQLSVFPAMTGPGQTVHLILDITGYFQ